MKRRTGRRRFVAGIAGAAAALGADDDADADQAKLARAAPAVVIPTFPLRDVFDSVQSAIRQKSIGQPVFVRLTVFNLQTVSLLDLAARLLTAAQSWVSQKAVSVFAARDSAKGDHLSLLCRFADGATALIAVHRVAPKGDGIDLHVVGNKGALVFEGLSATMPRAADSAGLELDAALHEAVSRAFETAGPVLVKGRE